MHYLKVVGAPFHGVRAREKWLPQLEPSAAGQLAGGECESMTFARERRTPASWSTPASRPFASEIRLSDADLRVLCCAAARPARRPGVDSFEVDPTGAQQPCGPSEHTVDSAGTTRPLCAPHPLIACTVLLPLSHRQRTVARSTPDGPYHSVKPIASVDARWVWTHPKEPDCRARHAVSDEHASSRTP